MAQTLTIVEHDKHEHAGRITQWCQSRSIVVNRIASFEQPDFVNLVCSEKLLLLGGPMNVGEPRLSAEQDWLERQIAKGVNVFGICLGAQMLAHALGSPISKLNQTELGWVDFNSERLGQTRYLKDFEKIKQLFVWHDYQFELPVQATSIGRSFDCACQGFELEKHVGLQFHPEWTQTMLALFASQHGWSNELIQQSVENLDALEIALFASLDSWWLN